MAKSTNNQRLYLDFNATSPLAPPVREYLAKGDFLFGNPASLHATGKRSKRAIGEVKDFLYQTFSLKASEFDLVFHSGASEGINQLVKGMAYQLGERAEKLHFFCFESDHSSVFEQRAYLENHGHFFSAIKVGRNGEVLLEETSKALSLAKGSILLNLTWANNETGALLDGEFPALIKKQFPKAMIHLDAVQGPGKIEEFQKLPSSLDAMTLSCHKFGALKGVGLSFLKKSLPWRAIIEGGDQQEGLRAGTENPDGIWSIKLALEWIMNQDVSRLRKARDKLEKEILKELGDQAVVAGGGGHRSANTSYIIIRSVKADILLTAFDLAGMDVSTGSACRSGSVSPSRVLLSMGHDDDEARGAVRLSLGHHLSDEDLDQLNERVLTVLRRFKKN